MDCQPSNTQPSLDSGQQHSQELVDLLPSHHVLDVAEGLPLEYLGNAVPQPGLVEVPQVQQQPVLSVDVLLHDVVDQDDNLLDLGVLEVSLEPLFYALLDHLLDPGGRGYQFVPDDADVGGPLELGQPLYLVVQFGPALLRREGLVDVADLDEGQFVLLLHLPQQL